MELAKLEIIVKIITLLILVSSTVLNIYLFFKSKQDKRFDLADEILARHENRIIEEKAARKEDLSRLGQRVKVLEIKIEAMPTHDDIREIHKRISDLATSMSAVSERSTSTNNAVNRIERYLLDQK